MTAATAAKPQTAPVGAPTFAPTWVTEVDLAEPLRELRAPARDDGRSFADVRVLVRLHGEPLGFVRVPLADGALPSDVLARTVEEDLGETIAARATSHPQAWEVEASASPPFVSVVICTRDRAESLCRTLVSVLGVQYPSFEVVVVDNAPRTDATRQVLAGLADERLRYVAEPRAGLSRARNCGVTAARGDIVAFTDDDVVVDPAWLDNLVRGFGRAEHVALVT